MIAECIPSATACVGSISTSSNPAPSIPERYSANESAPAMHPTRLPRSARSAGERSSDATTSLIPTRPPGRSTRRISSNTFVLSADRLITQLEMITSTLPLGSGTSSM